MKTKEEIVRNWLPRYTGEALENFGKYIILTNFSNYVSLFAEWNKVDIVGLLCKKGCLAKEELGLIEVLDYSSYAAVKRNRIERVVALIKGEKIKNKKVNSGNRKIGRGERGCSV